MYLLRCAIFLAAAGCAGSAFGGEAPSPALEGLAACGAVAEPAARASCYDAAYGALSRAVSAGEVIIVQRQEAQAAQRGAFGLNLPQLSIFDRANPDAKPLENVVDEARSVRRDEYGKWIVELADGAVWRQTDNEVLAPPPRPGSRVEIRRAAFGSYFMRIDDHKGVRAKRSE